MRSTGSRSSRRPAPGVADLPRPSEPRCRRSRSEETWEEVVLGEARNELELILPAYLQGQRWFGGKARRILSARLVDAVAVPYGARKGYLAFVRVDYAEADAELYSLPLTFAPAARADGYPARARVASLRRVGGGSDEEGILFDAFFDPDFSEALVEDESPSAEGSRGRGRGGVHTGVPEDGTFLAGARGAVRSPTPSTATRPRSMVSA